MKVRFVGLTDRVFPVVNPLFGIIRMELAFLLFERRTSVRIASYTVSVFDASIVSGGNFCVHIGPRYLSLVISN